MGETVFSLIAQKKLPAYMIYEDEKVLVFLAKDQVQLGHCLVVSRQPIDHWIDVPWDIYRQVQWIAFLVGKAIHKVTQCRRVVTATVGYEIPHYHYHLIPTWSMEDFDFRKARTWPAEILEDMRLRLSQAVSHEISVWGEKKL